jgi:hypothetical protein
MAKTTFLKLGYNGRINIGSKIIGHIFTPIDRVKKNIDI